MKTHVGITTNQHHSDQKPTELPKNAVRRVKEGTSAVLVQSDLSKKRQSDRRSTCEGICGTPFDGPVIPFGAEFYFCPISAEDKKSSSSVLRKRASRKIHRIRSEFWRRLGRDLIIADWHDIENNVASEVHDKRFKTEELGINCLLQGFKCPYADVSLRQKGHAQRQNLTPPESRELRRRARWAGEARRDPLQSAKG